MNEELKILEIGALKKINEHRASQGISLLDENRNEITGTGKKQEYDKCSCGKGKKVEYEVCYACKQKREVAFGPA